MISSSLFLNNCKDSSFDLSLQFNGYLIAEAKAELQKITALRLEKENLLKVKKKESCIHLNNNPLSTAGWQNRLTIERFASFN
jgi:hypothetical protein